MSYGVSDPTWRPPTPKPGFSDRGPWLVRGIISTILLVALFMGYALGLQVVSEMEPAPDWGFWFVEAGFWVAFVLVLLIWGRKVAQRILSAVVAMIFGAAYLVLVSPTFHRWLFVDLDLSADDLARIEPWVARSIYAALYCGCIFGWTIARRRSGFAFLGILIVGPLIAVAAWQIPKIDWTADAPVVFYQQSAVDLAVVVGGILIFCVVDAFRLFGRSSDGPGTTQPPANQWQSQPTQAFDPHYQQPAYQQTRYDDRRPPGAW